MSKLTVKNESTLLFNKHEIRFVEASDGKTYVRNIDIAKALGLHEKSIQGSIRKYVALSDIKKFDVMYRRSKGGTIVKETGFLERDVAVLFLKKRIKGSTVNTKAKTISFNEWLLVQKPFIEQATQTVYKDKPFDAGSKHQSIAIVKTTEGDSKGISIRISLFSKPLLKLSIGW